MPQNYITLPRSALYELVWSKPVRDVAADFGISDVALAKRCRALKIPLPPRGYWARVAVGQKPRRPPLPPFAERKRTNLPSYVTTRTADGTPAPEPAITFDPDRAADKLTIDDANLPAVTVPTSTDLASTLAIVKRTARHYKHPQRADLKFTRGETTGPILHLAVSPDALNRALLFADTLLRAAADQGWTPIPPREPAPPDPRHYYGQPPEPKPDTGPRYADLDVDGKRIEFQIEEAFDLRDLPPTAADLAKQRKYPYLRLEKRYEKTWTGRLRLKRAGHHYPYGVDGKSWYDLRGRTVEALIPRILADFRAVATRMQEVDEQRAREARERAEQERLRQEIAARRAANEELVHEFERQAGAWNRAQLLRRYLRAATRAAGPDGFFVNTDNAPLDFLAWAEHYVNQLDPLQPEPRDPDFQHERTFQYGSDEQRHEEERQRLWGHEWESCLKLVPDSTDTDDDDDAEVDDED